MKYWTLTWERQGISFVHSRVRGNSLSGCPVVADVHLGWRGGLCSRPTGTLIWVSRPHWSPVFVWRPQQSAEATLKGDNSFT